MKRIYLGALLSWCALTVLTTNARAQDGVLPSGFSEALVADGFPAPTAMEFAPDGRLFVALQNGRVRIVKNGVALANDFLKLTVDNRGERGLVGLTFDPNFAANRNVYVYYTVPGNDARGPFNRISRFRADAANPDLVEANSEQVLFELEALSGATNHNGGAMHFGPDGKLYVAVGDNAKGANAQNRDNLLGSMLRLNSDGTPATGNPYEVKNNRLDALWAMGLRNPFTFGFDPQGGRMLINDVGQATWEEINDGLAGSNYGWPTTEGPTTDARFRSPLYAYTHGGNADQGYAITGGVFYRGAQFPVNFGGKYFYADYVNGWIRTFDPQTNLTAPFAAPRPGVSPVDLDVGPDGALYYLAYGKGAVYRIAFGGAPAIVQQPQNQTAKVGQNATFRVVATGTAPLAYQWQRNGENLNGANSDTLTITVASADNGALYRCVVSNASGSAVSNSAALTVEAGQAPVAKIDLPLEGALYRAGETIAFEGGGTDAEDGVLPAQNLSWRVDFHHDTHLHPFVPETPGIARGSFTPATQGETADNVFYRVVLTVRDSSGQSATAFRDVLPRKANFTLQSSVPGLQVTLDGRGQNAPITVRGVVGVERTLGAVSPQVLAGVTYTFRAWSDGGALAHTISTPENDTIYTALWSDDRAPTVAFDGALVNGATYRKVTSVAGTASDIGVGLERIELQLQRDSDDFYYNGLAWVFTPSTYAAQGTSTWSANLPPLSDGGYNVRAFAFDAGGARGETAALRFSIDGNALENDRQAPQIRFAAIATSVLQTSFPNLTGTLSDAENGSGVARVALQLQRASDGAFWDGAKWSASGILEARFDATRWAYRGALPPERNTDGARYRVLVVAFDRAGNRGQAQIAFALDRALPLVSIETPRAGATLNQSELAAAPFVGGRASDSNGVRGVLVNLRRTVRIDGRVRTQFWAGGDRWTDGYDPKINDLRATIGADNENRDGVFWKLRVPQLLVGNYALRAISVDGAERRGSVVNTWRVVGVPLQVAIISPAKDAATPSLGSISGTASGSEIRGVTVVVFRAASENHRAGYWNGGDIWNPIFTSDAERPAQLRARGSEVDWELQVPNFAPGYYQLRATATDGNGARVATPVQAVVLGAIAVQ